MNLSKNRKASDLKGKIIKRFCRYCYTTTDHKVIEKPVPNSDKKFEEAICLKCLKPKKEKEPVAKYFEKLLNI